MAKKEEITGEWRKLHNDELHALYSLPNIIRSLKSRRLRWAGHVAHMKQSRNQWRIQNISLGGAHIPNHDKEINEIIYKNIITPVINIPGVILQKSDCTE